MLTGEAGLAIGASVLMHVTWNLMARHQPREAEPLWWVVLAHILLLGPWGLYCLATEVRWTGEFGLLLALSAAANALYFHGLQRAYEHGPVALVYPLVRSSPLLIALWSTLLFGESVGHWAWAGIAVSIGGLLLMAATAWRSGEGRAIPWALAAMLATSVYSLSDRAATAYVASFGGLLGFITVGYSLSWLLMTARRVRRGGRWRPAAGIAPLPLLVGGLCVGLAYALVIHAMRALPAAEVVAYTNAGIVIAGAISMAVFRERTRWQARTAGIALVCLGLGTLAMGR